jgi:hypothetical protein
MAQMGPEAAEGMKQSPLFKLYQTSIGGCFSRSSPIS